MRAASSPDGSPAFRIVPAEAADVVDLHELVGALADYERLGGVCTSKPEDLMEALFGPRPAAEALIARLEGECQICAGFALFFHTYSTFLGRRGLWLEDLFVRPRHRGRGIGRGLLTAVAQVACERDCGRFKWAVLDWNVGAVGFYEPLGATLLPDWRIARVTGEGIARLARMTRSGGSDPA